MLVDTIDGYVLGNLTVARAQATFLALHSTFGALLWANDFVTVQLVTFGDDSICPEAQAVSLSLQG